MGVCPIAAALCGVGGHSILVAYWFGEPYTIGKFIGTGPGWMAGGALGGAPATAVPGAEDVCAGATAAPGGSCTATYIGC